MLVWPDRQAADRAVRAWAERHVAPRLEVQRLGYFGSYANGTWGVGSDIDLVAIVSASDEPFERRSVKWPTERLPVPADLLVYTEPEWTAILERNDRLSRMLGTGVVWVFDRLRSTGC